MRWKNNKGQKSAHWGSRFSISVFAMDARERFPFSSFSNIFFFDKVKHAEKNWVVKVLRNFFFFKAFLLIDWILGTFRVKWKVCLEFRLVSNASHARKCWSSTSTLLPAEVQSKQQLPAQTSYLSIYFSCHFTMMSLPLGKTCAIKWDVTTQGLKSTVFCCLGHLVIRCCNFSNDRLMAQCDNMTTHKMIHLIFFFWFFLSSWCLFVHGIYTFRRTSIDNWSPSSSKIIRCDFLEFGESLMEFDS